MAQSRTMLSGLLRLGCATGVLAIVLLVSTASHAQTISEEARAYFRNGVELLEQTPPNYQDAYHQFKRAYESSQSWKVLGNLGLCALKLERDSEAIEYYQKYLEQGGSEVDPEERSAIERDLLLVKGNLAELQLTSDLPEVQVTDSRQGTNAPPQLYSLKGPTTLGLRAGTHTLVARAQGKELKWEVVLSPGQPASHEFKFAAPEPQVATPPPAAVTPPPEPSPDRGSGSPLRTIGFVTAGIGGAALIGGVVTGILSKKAEKEAKEGCIGDVCQEAAEEKFNSADKLATMTNILLIGGGVLAATGVTLIIVGGPSAEKNPTSATLRISPALGCGEGALLAYGTF